MRQTFTRLLLLGITILSTLSASAYDAEINGIYYNLYANRKNAVVTSGSNKYTGDVVIPATVIYNDETYSVTRIENGAFQSCNSLSSVTIPNSVTSIGSAFLDCCSLTSVTIPNSVTSIEERAFSGCSSLTSITIPNSVKRIGFGTFGGCSSLTSITIPNSVTIIGSSAFNDCSSLTSVTIPNSVTIIGSFAFDDCSSLTSVTIPYSVTRIESGAFQKCTNLTSITISNPAMTIGLGAFSWCDNLTSVTNLSKTPQLIDSDAFSTYGTLYVPKGSKAAYEAAKVWKNFTIEEIDVTAIEQTDADNTHIVDTYTLDGKRAANSQRGIRVIRYSDGTTKKVM